MKIIFDPAKDAKNRFKHGISLAMTEDFDFTTAVLRQDSRRNYGEIRWCAHGYIGVRLYALTFTYKRGAIRAISLRRANKREERYYAEKTG